MDLKRHHLNRNGEVRTNNHHLFFERRRYAGHIILNALRNHEAAQHVIEVPRHEQLHQDMGGLAMGLTLARVSLEFLNNQPNFYGPEDKMYSLADYYFRISRTNGHLNREAGKFSEHLESQFKYLPQ